MIKSRGGQVTIFVIIAILIIGAVITIFLFRDNLGLNIGSSSSEAVSYVDNCIESTIMNSIYLVGLQGGYSTVPEPKKSFGPIYVPIYYTNPKSNLPTITVFQTELANNIKENLIYCENKIRLVEEKGYNVSIGKVKSVKVSFKGSEVIASVNWPIIFTNGKDVEQISSFEKKVRFDFLSKYKILSDFMKEQEEKPTEILLTRIAEIGDQNDFVVEGQILNETSEVMYGLVYEKEAYNNRTYVFSFVSKY